jgi:hypothetical protein
MERAKSSAALVLALSDNDGAPRVAAAAGASVPFAEMLAAVLPMLAQIEDAPDAGEEHEGTLSIDDRKFVLVTLPRDNGRQSPIVLLLEQSEETSQNVPLTLLARLAEGVRSELSLSQESADSMPDSDISQTFG